MELSQEIKDELNAISKLLNGQIRGSINKVAKDTNLEYIQMTLHDVYIRGVNKGYKKGVQDTLTEQLKDELKGGD